MRKVGPKMPAAPEMPAVTGKRRRKLELYATAGIGGLSIFFMQTPPSWAQSVNAGFAARNTLINSTFSPSAELATGVPSNETRIQVNAPQAIIDWTPNSNQFVLGGTTTTFYNTNSGNYTVLNVIASGTAPMQFNGSVVSKINGFGGATGGNVWFYSPGGIVVGSGGSFNVGSLLLTTLNPDTANLPGQNFTSFNDGVNGTIGLRTDTAIFGGDNTSQIQINGGSITAQNYVGLVAPRVVNNGYIRAGGAIGLVAGEQVDLTIEATGGLFAIGVPLGTSYQGNTVAGAAIIQTAGATGVDASNAGTENTASTFRNIYMVAVPKNTAVTMLLSGGSIGYSATSASAGTDGTILLAGASQSTGFDIQVPYSDYTASNSVPTGTTTSGTIQIGGAFTNLTFSSNLTASASNIEASTIGADLSFTGNAQLIGGLASHLTVGAGRTVNVNGNLAVISQNFGETGYDTRGRDASVTVNGTLRVASSGTLKIDAGSTSNSGSGTDITAGLATLQINDGIIEGAVAGTRGGDVSVLADAIGGGGLTQGGTASVLMTGGTARLLGLTIRADGTGSDNFIDAPGAGHGGIASLTVNAGTVTPTVDIGGNALFIYARGTGGTAISDPSFFDGSGDLRDAPGLAGSIGIGGSATLTVSAPGSVFGPTPGQEFDVTLNASGVGGGGGLAAASGSGPYPNGGAGALGQGGTATMTVSQGVSRLRSINLIANGQGGNGGSAGGSSLSFGSDAGNGGAGGEGNAGVARAIFSGNNTQLLGNDSGYSFTLSGSATGGGGGSSLTQTGGLGGAATANGLADGISLTALGLTTIQRSSITLGSSAQGGAGGDGSAIGGDGGAATASATLLTTLSGVSQITTDSLNLTGSASGGLGGSGSGTSTGGTAMGGAATINIGAGPNPSPGLSVTSSASLYTVAFGGGSSSVNQGSATSGSASITATGTVVSFNSLSVTTSANNAGIAPPPPIGGAAQGGAITISALQGGHLTATNGYQLDSHGSGGGGSSFPAAGTGGAITIQATNNALIDTGAFAFSPITSYGSGGTDPFAGAGTTGGIGQGGDQTITAANNSVINLGGGGLQLTAYGQGGSGETAGVGVGGNVTISANGNQSGFFLGSGLNVQTYAQPGGGNTGADDNAGSFSLSANDGFFQIGGSLEVNAISNGGSGTGGAITIETLGSAASSTASAIGGTVSLDNTADTGNTITIRNTVAGAEDPLTLGNLNVTAEGAGSGESFVIEVGSNQINAGAVDIRTDGPIRISSLSPVTGGFNSTGRFYASSPTAITVTAVNANVPTITARSIELNYSNIDTRGTLLVANGDGSQGQFDGVITLGSFTSVQAGNLQSTIGVDVTATSNISVNNASATAAAQSLGSGVLNSDIGYVRLTAGDYTGPNDGRSTDDSANIDVLGTVAVTGTISLTAPNNVRVGATGALLSDNEIGLSIGNDLFVDAGGTISALINPLSGTISNLDVLFNNSANAHSIVNAGTITTNDRALNLSTDTSANAIDSTGGTFSGDSVTLDVTATSFSGDDNGVLTNCLIGSICLGTVTAPGTVNIGVNGQIPTSVTLGGPIQANDLSVIASNSIALASTGFNPIAATGDVYFDAGNGDIISGDSGIVSGATIGLRGNNLLATGHTFQTNSGDLSIDMLGTIQVGGLISAGRLGSNPDGFVEGLFQPSGDFSAGLVSVAGGDVAISATNVTIGTLQIANGNAINLNAQGGALNVTSAAASSLGTAASAVLQGDTIFVGLLGTTGNANFIGSGAVAVSDVLAGGVVNASGSTVGITSSGAMNVASLVTSAATLRAAGLLTLSGQASVGTLRLTSDTAGVTVTGAQSAGATTIRAAGNIALDTFSGTSIDLRTSAGDIFANSLSSAGATLLMTPGTIALPVLNSIGAIFANGGAAQIGGTALTFASLATTAGDARVTTSGNLVVNGGSATGSAIFTSTAGRVTAATYSATQDITLLGTTIGNFTNLTGRNISITAQTGSFSGVALNASGTTFLQAPINVSVSALNSTGGVTASARGLSLFAPAAMTVASATAGTGGMTLSAGGQLTVTSSTSAADSILESTGGGVTIGSATSTGPTTVLGAGTITAFSISGSRVRVETTAGGIAAQSIAATSAAPSNPGTTTLSAPGAITVAALTSTGAVTAAGGSVAITSPGALTFANAAAADGGVNLATQGTLTVNAASATGDSSFVAGGQLTLASFATAGDLILSGNGIAGFTSLSGRNVSLIAQSGSISGQTLTASGTTSLSAPVNVSISALDSAGGVSVSGQGISLFAPNALTVTSATAGSGGMTLSAGGLLTVGTASSGTDLVLESTNGGITAQNVTVTGPLTLDAAQGAVHVSSLSAGGAVNLTSQSAQIVSPGALTFANAVASNGGLSIATQGALTVTTASATDNSLFVAGGLLTLPSFATAGDLVLQGDNIAAFTVLSGRNVSLVANSGAISGQTLTATGTTNLSTTGAINISALGSVGGVTATGSRITLTSPDALTIASFTTSQGDAVFRAANLLTVNQGSSVSALSMTSDNAGLAIGSVDAAGAVTGAAAGPITFTQVGGDTVTLGTSAGGISGQQLMATTTATLTAPGAISVTTDFRAASASVTGSSVAIVSTQPLTFSTLTATSGDVSIQTPGSVTVNGGSAAGAGSFASGDTLNLVSYTTGTDLILSAARLPSFGTLSARNISLTALASDLTGGTLTATGTTNLSASGALRITDLRSAGAATLSGATVDVGSTVALNVANAAAGDGGLRLRSTGTLTVANATSTASVDLASTGGNVTVGTITMTGTPAGITQQAVAGTSPLTIASAGATTLNGAITGAGAATISGTGLVLNNAIDASGISLVSQTIAVGSQAAIGNLARTGTVAFTNSGTGRSFIGGTGSQSGYSLDANALSRIQASSVTLSLPRAATSSTATPDVVIGGFTLYGPAGTPPAGARQNLGAGLLSISTPGLVQVNGPVRLANLQSTGTSGLAIRAAGIDVVTPTGSILQTDASGAPAGTLDLNARTVRVASASALADLSTLATPAEREARLAQNDGNMSDVGWLSANTIRFSYPSGTTGGNGLATVYVQNSGGNGATARRGLTTGAGGVVIAGFPSSDQPEVFINGRLQTGPTTFVTGTAFLQSISQTGSAADILVNGCAPATGVCTGDTTGLTLISQLAPPQDLIGVISNSTDEDDDEDTNEPGDPVPSRDPNAIIQFASPDPEMGSQTTDDPVVGSGNESLWSGSSGAPGEAGGTSSFDTTIGVGNDAGSPDSGGNTSRSGAGGANSGSTPQQPGERATGLTPTGDGGLGVGNDAGSGGEQRFGNGTSGAAGSGAGGANTPNTPNSPANLQNGGGAVGIGGDSGGAGGAGGGTNSGGGTLPGATQGTTGGTTNGGTNNNRGTGAAAAEQTTGTGGDAGDTSGNGAGSSGSGSTPGAAGAATPGTTTNTNNNRQTDPNAPR